ncbi:MAG TPA: response regulator [Polyangiaceae bacterium]|jgi:CheY-like chemotaxis protein
MKKLFLVDADPFTLCVLDVSLRSAGYDVTTAADGAEAWLKLEAAPPHLVVADTRLPKLDGFALVRKLKDRPELARIPVIFLATQESVADRERALELGVEDYLPKPAYLRELIARIDLLIARTTRQRVSAGHTQSFGRGRLTGSTADFALVDILQSFERTRKGGTLYVRQGTQEVQIAFRDGRPIDAHMGEVRGEEAIYRALVWKEASFEIDFKPVADDDVIGKTTHAILLKGMRRLDDWVRLCEQVKPLATLLDVHPPLLVERLARMGELPDDLESMLHLPLRAAVAAGHAEPPREDPSERSVRAAEPVAIARPAPVAPPSTPVVAATMTPPAPSEPPPSVRPPAPAPMLAVVPVASTTPVLSTVSSPVVSGSVRPTPSQRPSAAPWTVDPEGEASAEVEESDTGIPHGIPGSGRRATFALGVAAALLLVAGGVYSLRGHEGPEVAKAGEDTVAAAAPAAPEPLQTAAVASAAPAAPASAEGPAQQAVPTEAPVDGVVPREPAAANPAPAFLPAPGARPAMDVAAPPAPALLPPAPVRIVRETALDVKGTITSKSPLVRDAERALLKGETDRAQALSQQAVDTNPSDADAWLTLAAARKASGDVVSARQAYRNCIEQAHTVDVDHCRILAAQ